MKKRTREDEAQFISSRIEIAMSFFNLYYP